MKKTFNHKGRAWSCWFTELTQQWTAVSTNPDIRIHAPTWEDLREEMTTMDTSKSRQDAVAIADPLPPIGAGQGF